MSTRQHLDWLSALRGIAALAVVLTHSRRVFLDTPMWGIANGIFLPFASGVDLFFVISGFIMFYTTYGQSGAPALATFAKKRFLRIWPAYFVLSLIAMLIAGGFGFWMHQDQLQQFLLSIAFLPVNGNAIFSRQALSVGWTINYEAYFYLIFGLALLAGKYRWLAIAAWFIFSLVALPLIFGAPSLWYPAVNYTVPLLYPNSYLRTVTNPIIWEFVGGILAGAAFVYSGMIKSQTAAKILAVTAIIFALLNTWYFYNYISLGMGAGFTILVASLAIASKTINFAVPRFLTWLGDISYTLYLEHLLIIELARQTILPKPENAFTGAIEMAAIAMVCVLTAGLTSPFLEHRLPDLFEKAFNATRKVKLARSHVNRTRPS